MKTTQNQSPNSAGGRMNSPSPHTKAPKAGHTCSCNQDKERRELVLRDTQELGMPCPRLQFTWMPLNDDWSQKECEYSLVLPIRKFDIRREGKGGKPVRREYHAHIGSTTSTGSARRPIFDGTVDAPFRDGAHAQWDSQVLGLPVYAVCEDEFTRLNTPVSSEPHNEPDAQAAVRPLKKG